MKNIKTYIYKYGYLGFLGCLSLMLLLCSYFYKDANYTFFGLIILLPLITYLFLYKFKWLYYLMIFTLPLSIHLDDIGMGIGLSLPGEVLLVFVFVGVIWRLIFRFDAYKTILFHPVSLLIFGHLIWMMISSFWSVLPVVSIKYLLLRTIYIVVFYIYGTRLFLDSGRLKLFLTTYIWGFVPVIIYTLVNHYLIGGLSLETANRPSYPFFNDHTIYATCITMLLPLVLIFAQKKGVRVQYLAYALLFLVALYFSYSRAALISVALGGVYFLCLHFRLKLIWTSLVFAIIAGTSSLYFLSKKCEPVSVKPEGDFTEMVSSLSDEENHSNTERLNRWGSAFKMFKEKPFLGFGPGTYVFVYGRYQEGKTFVSVNDASMGGAHSEYLKPLSEEGLLGFLFVIGVLSMVYFYSYKLTNKLNGSKRLIIIACIVGLTTYYIHGVFNFFLDTDKASVLYWGLIAYIVALDIRFESMSKK